MTQASDTISRFANGPTISIEAAARLIDPAVRVDRPGGSRKRYFFSDGSTVFTSGRGASHKFTLGDTAGNDA